MEKDIHDRLDRARTIATENVKKATTKATTGIKEGAERVKEGAERVSERARAASANAGETLDKAKEQAGRAANKANHIITEHPLAAAAAAVAIGAVAAYMFPRSTRKLRSAAPKLLTAASTIGLKVSDLVAEQTKKATPAVEESEHLLGRIGDAARKAPASAAEVARTGIDSARAGIGNARDVAAEALRKAEIEDHASKLLDAASGAAAKLAAKLRDHAKRAPKA